MEKLGQTSKTLEKGTSNDVENPLNDLIKPVRTLWRAPSAKQKLKIVKDIRFKLPFNHTRNITTSLFYPSLSRVCTCQKRKQLRTSFCT